MDFEGANLFLTFYANIDVFLLVLVRILGFVIIIPVLSGQNIPVTVRLGFAVAVAYIVVLSGNMQDVVYHNSVPGYLWLVVREFITGFLIGYVVYLIFNVFFLAGQLIDYQIGFSMVSVLDPQSQTQVPVTGNLIYLLMSMLFVETGGLHAFISAFIYSFNEIPLGSAVVITNGSLMQYLMNLLAEFFVIGVKISLPVMGSILIIDIALGILVKAVPQMNVFVVGMPIKLILGLLVFLIVTPAYSSVYDFVFHESYRNIVNIIEAISP